MNSTVLVCAMHPWKEGHKPDCPYLDGVHLEKGYCTAPDKDKCLTLRHMLEYAARRRNIAEMELRIQLERDPEKRLLYRASLNGAQMKGEG